jgi:hypothetical protein
LKKSVTNTGLGWTEEELLDSEDGGVVLERLGNRALALFCVNSCTRCKSFGQSDCIVRGPIKTNAITYLVRWFARGFKR